MASAADELTGKHDGVDVSSGGEEPVETVEELGMSAEDHVSVEVEEIEAKATFTQKSDGIALAMVDDMEEYLTPDEARILRGRLNESDDDEEGLLDEDKAKVVHIASVKKHGFFGGYNIREERTSVPYFVPTCWEFIRVFFSTIFSTVAGLFMSVLICNSLIQMTASPIFSILFCIVLLCLSALFICLACAPTFRRDGSGVSWKAVSIWKRVFVLLLSVHIFVAAVCSILLCHPFIPSIHWVAKIFMYTIVSMACSFALTYTAVEVVNVLYFLCCFRSAHVAFLSHIGQHVLIFFGALIMGASFGVLFGLMDPEDDLHPGWNRLMLAEVLSFPVGLIFGFFGGFVNETLHCFLERQYFEKIGSQSQKAEFLDSVDHLYGDEDQLELSPQDEL